MQRDLHGDFVLFGNTLGWNCSTGDDIPAPVLGTTSGCSGLTSISDSGIDLFWRSDSPNAGDASTTNDPTQARSTAVLELPAGARINYARFYWGGFRTGATRTVDTNAIIEHPQTNQTFTAEALADSQWSVAVPSATNQYWYQASADITEFLQSAGTGAYRVSDVTAALGNNSEVSMAGWAVVVFYELDNDTPRNLALFDGLDAVGQGVSFSSTLSGFLVPQAGFKAKLGVLAYEGDEKWSGDQLVFNGTAVGDDINPTTNFFNGTYSNLNSPASRAGDLPHLTGSEGSMSGIDIDVVDVTDRVKKGDTSATVSATTGSSTSADRYVLGAFVTSISTYKPDFSTSGKTVSKVTPGALRPGSVIEYTVTVKNSGNDESTKTVLTDQLPAQVTYAPGSLTLVSPDGKPLSDAKDGDEGEYDSTTRTITVRLGTSANGDQGGNMAIGDTIVVKFQASLNGDAAGTIDNQAVITADGKLGADTGTFPTDGNGTDDGVPPTGIIVDNCGADADCVNPTPYCDLFSSPHTCVACITSDECTSPTAPECNMTTRTCECPSGIGSCLDTDGDGLTDVTETTLGTNPNDADSDDDGVPDGSEYNPGDDTDGDGLINALDPDSDNDGLFDGTEMGYGCADSATDPVAKRCRADEDNGATKTNPLDWDSDDGGVSDGSEDANLNGVVDDAEGESDPNYRDDDTGVVDTDQDGLSDALETAIDSYVNDRDSDDDGVVDGAEANPTDDVDRDGAIDVLDQDSDGDGLFDGTEMGLTCSDSGTNTSANHCTADADGGQTRTSPVVADTDHGGRSDGNEDRNHDGRVDSNERNPNNELDDSAQCYADAECGDNTSGKVCNESHLCIDGCRGTNGNGCLLGQTCSSTNETIGSCSGQALGTGGASSTGGGPSTGGDSSLGGSGGDTSLGGALAVGGDTSASGGDTSLGGALAVGGDTSFGGALSTGGDSSQGGAVAAGGDSTQTTEVGGNSAAGGAATFGGSAAIGGSGATGGGAGTGGAELDAGTPDAGNETGGAPGAGGTSSEESTGGATAYATNTTGTEVGAPDTGVAVEGGGCSCGVVGSRRTSGMWLAIAASLLAFWRKRRAR
jgi:uncharacterized repeat protein (TIGR01451 family)